MPSRKVKILSSCHDGLFLRDMMMMPGTTVSTVSKSSYSCTLHTAHQHPRWKVFHIVTSTILELIRSNPMLSLPSVLSGPMLEPSVSIHDTCRYCHKQGRVCLKLYPILKSVFRLRIFFFNRIFQFSSYFDVWLVDAAVCLAKSENFTFPSFSTRGTPRSPMDSHGNLFSLRPAAKPRWKLFCSKFFDFVFFVKCYLWFKIHNQCFHSLLFWPGLKTIINALLHSVKQLAEVKTIIFSFLPGIPGSSTFS